MQTIELSNETKVILGRTILNLSVEHFKWRAEKALSALLDRIGNPITTEDHMKALDVIEEVYFKAEAYKQECEKREDEFILTLKLSLSVADDSPRSP